MVHVRLDAAAPAAQTLQRLVAAGLRITAVSETGPDADRRLSAARCGASRRSRPRSASRARRAAPAQPRRLGAEPGGRGAEGGSGAGARRRRHRYKSRRAVRQLSHRSPPTRTPPTTWRAAICRAASSSSRARISRRARATTKAARCCSSCTTWRRAPRSGSRAPFIGEVQFSNNILSLRRSFDADVIVDDVIYFDEPMFSDGLLAQTVDKVVSEGAAYFSSAGEQRPRGLPGELRSRFDRRGRDSWSRRARRTSTSMRSLPTGFRPRASTNSATVTAARASRSASRRTSATSSTSSGTSRSTSARSRPTTTSTSSTRPVISSTRTIRHSDAFFTSDDNIDTDQALELMAVNPGTYQIVIAKVNDGPARRIKYVTVNGTGESEIQNAPSIWGHTAARRGQSVGAMYYAITEVSGRLQLAGAGDDLLRQARPPARRARRSRGAADHRRRRRGHDVLPAGGRHRRQRPSELLRHQRRRAGRRRGRRAGASSRPAVPAISIPTRSTSVCSGRPRRSRCRGIACSPPRLPDRWSPRRTAISPGKRTTGRSPSSRSPARRSRA